MLIKLRFRIKKRNIITINDVNINKININFILKLIFFVIIVEILFNKLDLISSLFFLIFSLKIIKLIFIIIIDLIISNLIFIIYLINSDLITINIF